VKVILRKRMKVLIKKKVKTMMMYVGIKKKLERNPTKVGMGTFKLETDAMKVLLKALIKLCLG
jgi:hypothetical protein